jgi:hypothetical protein
VPPAIVGQRLADIVDLLELTLLVASDIPLVAFVGLDEFTFSSHARRFRKSSKKQLRRGSLGSGGSGALTLTRLRHRKQESCD